MARESSAMRLLAGGAMVLAALGASAPAMADVLQIGTAGVEWVAGGPPLAPAPVLIETSPAAAAQFDAVAPDPIDAAPAAAAGYAPTRVDEASGVVFIGDSGPAPARLADPPLTGPLPLDADIHPLSITEALDAAGPTRWRARVAQLAAKYDISPALLEAVVWQESRWNERAISPVGARGLAQLMPGTAAQMGVDAGDPMANLEGGARYLRMQLDAFEGNVEKALAAYNAGPARVLRAGGIPNIRETREYVAAIMARLTAPMRR